MLVLPFGFLAGGGPVGNLIPVAGYQAYLDFGESNYLLLDGSGNIETAYDISGNGYDATQPTAGSRPSLTDTGKSATYYQGNATSSSLFWSSMDSMLQSVDPATNEYTVIAAFDESSQRRQPFGLGTGGVAPNRRLEFFFNDSVGRRDLIALNRQVFFNSSNNSAKDIILYGQSNTSNVTVYGYMNTGQSGTNSTNWQSDSFNTFSRIGNTARGATVSTVPGDTWRGKIYFIAVYHTLLTLSDRESIRDWAVDKWGLTLT